MEQRENLPTTTNFILPYHLSLAGEKYGSNSLRVHHFHRVQYWES
jgi:hypothetical protein